MITSNIDENRGGEGHKGRMDQKHLYNSIINTIYMLFVITSILSVYPLNSLCNESSTIHTQESHKLSEIQHLYNYTRINSPKEVLDIQVVSPFGLKSQH